jgi:hypothetical protein
MLPMLNDGAGAPNPPVVEGVDPNPKPLVEALGHKQTLLDQGNRVAACGPHPKEPKLDVVAGAESEKAELPLSDAARQTTRVAKNVKKEAQDVRA